MGFPPPVISLLLLRAPEENVRVDNLGCKPRGRKSDGPFRHDTGAGWVKGKKEAYNDAIYKKNNAVEVLLHENLGGGFSPPAATKMRRNGRKARDHGIDRTPYQAGRTRYRLSASTRVPSLWASPRPRRRHSSTPRPN